MLYFHFGIVEKDETDLLPCDITVEGSKLSVNNGQAEISTDERLAIASKTHGSREGSLLPFNQGSFIVTLPSYEEKICDVSFKLLSNGVTLHELHYHIQLHGKELDDYQKRDFNIENPPRKMSPQGFYGKPKAQQILYHFQIMADNALREEFFRKRMEMEQLANAGDKSYIDLLPFVLFEEGLMDLHENKLVEVENCCKKALDYSKTFGPSNNHYYYLWPKIKFLRSAIIRREGKLTEAEELVKEGLEIQSYCVSGYETAEACYAYATFLVEKSAEKGLTKEEKNKAKEFFEHVNKHLEPEKAARNPSSQRLRARNSNRKLSYVLKTSRHAKKPVSRETVSPKRMMEAWKEIERVEGSWAIDSYTEKQKMSFWIFKGDYFLRKRDYSKAHRPLNKARAIALQNGWHKFDALINSRLLCATTGERKLLV